MTSQDHRGSPRRRSLLQDHSGEQRVTNIELFFDLVYVFAVTQMSHHLLAEPTVDGALQSLERGDKKKAAA